MKYYGEYYMKQLDLARNAVVALNRLCYASGNNEWGAGNPTKSTAIKRVDNYGYGFLKAGAKAVFASGITSIGYVVRGLFRARRRRRCRACSGPTPTRRPRTASASPRRRSTA